MGDKEKVDGNAIIIWRFLSTSGYFTDSQLVMLLEYPGEVVTREELQKQLWQADTFVDFDPGLNRAINRLRDALGDAADSPRFVETIPRRGYRFTAPVEIAGEVASVLSPVGELTTAGSFRRRQLTLI